MVQPQQPPNLLIIKKDPFVPEVYPMPLNVTTELHTRVKKLSQETNQPIHKIACQLVSFALEHVKIEG